MASEFRLLCLALRRHLRQPDLTALRQLMADGLDWDRVVEAARRHRVAPLLLAGLNAVRSTDLPPGIAAALRAQARAAATVSLAQAGEVARLSRIFAAAGIPMLALKGVVLSLQLYGDAALRNPRDIDVLVAPETFPEAEALLLASGYRCCGPALSPRQTASYRRWVKEAEYAHLTTGLRIELHHRLSDNPRLIPFEFGTLWREREEVSLAGAAVATLPRRHLGLYLAMHGASHCWERLQWLVDLTGALRASGAVETTLAAAEQAGLAVPMLHALRLAHDWLALPLDDGLLARTRADRSVARLDRILAHSYSAATWYRTPPRRSLVGVLRYSLWLRLYAYSLKADWRYWKNQAMGDFVTPADWSVLPLPDRLFWLFPLLRVLGWLMRRRVPSRER